MNILVVGKFFNEGFASHIRETLEDMGHLVVSFEPGIKVHLTKTKFEFRMQQIRSELYNFYKKLPFYSNILERKITNVLDQNSIDLCICCSDFLTPKEISKIKQKKNIPVVLWFPDAISNFGKAMFLNAQYDYLFFKEPFVVDVLRRELKKNAFYLPECCNPKYHRSIIVTPKELQTYKCDITTAGNMHSARSAFFQLLPEYDVKIWGNPAPYWMNTTGIESKIQNRFVSNIEKAKAFLAAKIVLNNLYPTEIYGINVRTFEIAAIGAFQISSNRKAIYQLYNPNELITFDTMDDLKEKINYYLLNDKERSLIAEKAMKRTHVEHTYQVRLQLLLDTVFSLKKGFDLPKWQ